MRFLRWTSKRKKAKNKINRHANRPSWGRISRMELLEDRRVLASFYVFGNGDSIQDAIDDAANRQGPDTVYLKSDTYTQSVVIDDDYPLTIVGLGHVTLNPGLEDDTVTIRNSKHVTLKNLTIREALEDNVDAENTYKVELYDVRLFDSGDDGFDADGVDYFHAYNSKFNDNADNGIELQFVGYAFLKNVHANYNGTEIYDPSNGESLVPVPDENLSNNGLVYVNARLGEQAAAEGFTIDDEEYGKLKIYGGEFNSNEMDGIHTDGLKEIRLEMIYANDNEDDGVDTAAQFGAAYLVDVNYATFKRNGEDGLDVTADYSEITSTRAQYNENNGVVIEDGYKAYVYWSNYSHNGGTGLDVFDVSKVIVDNIDANYNGQNIPNTGAAFVNVDDLDITTAEFNYNYGPGIYVAMNYGGHTYIDYVDASYNSRDGVELLGGSAHIESFSSNYNGLNGIRSVNLHYLYIHNTESKYNRANGLEILGGRMTGATAAPPNGQNRGTDVHIVWSEFVGNRQDGIHAEEAGYITLDRMQSIYNHDDGFESINPYARAKVIDSLFAHNGDRQFIEFFGVPI